MNTITKEENGENNSKRRAAGLHDDADLFRQPRSTYLGECPICFLPMPLDGEKWSFWPCCSRNFCKGCIYANYISNKHDRMKAWSCPFCREPLADNEENIKRMMKRIKANDPDAMTQMGAKRNEEGDHDAAVEYWTKASELGGTEAHHHLGFMYWKGDGVEKDVEKKVYHLEKAAIGGDPDARHHLGIHEERNDNIERAVKHFIIAANLGYEKSMKYLWECYKDGDITKEDLEGTLRTHQAAINEMKSPEREAAEAWRKRSAQRG